MSAYSESSRLLAIARPFDDRKRLEPELCTVCAHITAHHWNGLDKATHCRACHAIFGGQQAHCTLCHRTFSTNGVVDHAHTTYRDRDGELRRRCHDPATKSYFGEPRPNRWGTPIWRREGDQDALDRRAGKRQRPENDAGGTS